MAGKEAIKVTHAKSWRSELGIEVEVVEVLSFWIYLKVELAGFPDRLRNEVAIDWDGEREKEHV